MAANRRRRADQRPAEGLERLALLRADRRWASAPARASTSTTSTSFACDLKKWLQIMETYEDGGHAYHATMPTDALTTLRDVMLETERLRLRPRAASDSSNWAGACAPCWQSAASRAWRARLRGTGRGGQLHHRPGHPDRQEIPRRWPANAPLACRCNAMKVRISAPSASACSVWKNCTTRNAP